MLLWDNSPNNHHLWWGRSQVVNGSLFHWAKLKFDSYSSCRSAWNWIPPSLLEIDCWNNTLHTENLYFKTKPNPQTTNRDRSLMFPTLSAPLKNNVSHLSLCDIKFTAAWFYGPVHRGADTGVRCKAKCSWLQKTQPQGEKQNWSLILTTWSEYHEAAHFFNRMKDLWQGVLTRFPSGPVQKPRTPSCSQQNSWMLISPFRFHSNIWTDLDMYWILWTWLIGCFLWEFGILETNPGFKAAPAKKTSLT